MEQRETNSNALAAANQRFYDAFATLEIEEMDAVWEHSDRARCLHPGWPLIVGWEQIRESWESIFDNTTLMHFIITEVEATAEGDCAWVDCVENITSVVNGRAASFTTRATNIFALHEEQWYMVHHHASP